MERRRANSPTLLMCLLVSFVGAALWCPGCAARRALALPDRRPSDFTLGVVVFCDSYTDEKTDTIGRCPARYIVDPSGELRVSIGAGSTALVHPRFTRRLDPAQLDALWARVRAMGLDQQTPAIDIEPVRSPEIYAPESGEGYLIEIRSRARVDSWSTRATDAGPAHELVEMLASLAWIRD